MFPESSPIWQALYDKNISDRGKLAVKDVTNIKLASIAVSIYDMGYTFILGEKIGVL